MAEQPGTSILTETTRYTTLLNNTPPATSETEALRRIQVFEELKATLTAAQAHETIAFEQLRIQRDRANKVPAHQQGVRVGDEIGFARKMSPGAGRKFLTTARTLTTDLPCTLRALKTGVISEAKATIISNETNLLPPEERTRVDLRLSHSLPVLGTQGLKKETRALAAELDAETAEAAVRKAEENRRVTLVSSGHGMGRLTAHLPLVQAVAVYEGLSSQAKTVIAAGDGHGRTQSQVMADTLTTRVTGQHEAGAVPVEVNMVIDAQSLLADGTVPAWLPGFGPLPAPTARSFVAANRARVFVRRLFTDPTGDQLVGMESRGRVFTGLLRKMVVFRDDVCRTPWCDALIKHIDHATPVAAGGVTSWSNASGLCASCNYAKEHPGWAHRASEDGLTVVTASGAEFTTTTRPLLTRMGVPRRSVNTRPGARDWMQALSGFINPPPQPTHTRKPERTVSGSSPLRGLDSETSASGRSLSRTTGSRSSPPGQSPPRQSMLGESAVEREMYRSVISWQTSTPPETGRASPGPGSGSSPDDSSAP